MESSFVYNILSRYFDYLSISGKVNKKDQCKMLLMTFLHKLLNSELSVFITEEDYALIDSILNEMYGSHCLIPYPEYKNRKAVNRSNNVIIASPSIRDTNIGLREANDLYRIV